MPLTRIRFKKEESRGLSSKTLRTALSAMERDGAVVFENLFPGALLERLRRDVARRLKTDEFRRRGVVRDIAGRYAALVPFEGPFLDPAFYANPTLHAMLGGLLGAEYCIGSLEVVVAVPGADRQHQHVDGPIRFDRLIDRADVGFPGDLSKLPPYAATLCVPLCDIDESNGPTAIWRGSHKSALKARPPRESRINRDHPVELMIGKFGRTFLFDFRVFHGGMPNDSREPRPVLMFVFTRRWYRDPNLADVQPSILLSQANFRKVPRRHRSLFMLAPAARRELWARHSA